MDAAADFARDVERETYALRVRGAAREKHAAERGGEAPPFDGGLLTDLLARPQDPPHRIEGLIPSEASTLIVAQKKTGKTTLMLNLARCLINGEDFLGRFATRPLAGRVALLNFEVSGRQASAWAEEVGVRADQLYIANLRGRRNPLAHAQDRATLADILRGHQVETLIVDPFGRAYTGSSQNDSGEVGSWLVSLDMFARAEVGATDLILTAHAGWDGERTRGSSALEDWADSIITMVRDKDDKNIRYLRAEGRDVAVDEDLLHFEPETRTLTLAGAGSRKSVAKARKIDGFIGYAVDTIREESGLSGYKLEQRLKAKGLSFQRGDVTAAALKAVQQGLLTSEPGPRNSVCFHLPDLPRPSPGDGGTTFPTSLYRREVVPGQVDDDQDAGKVAPRDRPSYFPRCDRCHDLLDRAASLTGATTCTTCEMKELTG